MRLSTSSGAAATWRKFSRDDVIAFLRNSASATFFGSGFISSSGMLFVTEVNGVKSGFSVKQSNIGVAVASNWFIGGSPRICSIVRRMLVVLYCVFTTSPRFVYGLMQ